MWGKKVAAHNGQDNKLMLSRDLYNENNSINTSQDTNKTQDKHNITVVSVQNTIYAVV